jgi:hypothetical protein
MYNFGISGMEKIATLKIATALLAETTDNFQQLTGSSPKVEVVH